MMTQHIRVTVMVALITLLSIGLLGGGGYLLDQQFDTKPFLTIAGVLISFPLSQFIIYRWVKGQYVPSIVKKSQHSSEQ